jgi:hypothetical protein
MAHNKRRDSTQAIDTYSRLDSLSRRLFHPNSARYRGAFLFRALTRCRFSQYLPAGPPVCWRKAARINKNEKKKKIRKRKKEKKKKNMIFTTRR